MIVLASGSPRRKYLLSLCGYEFMVHSVEVDESVLVGEEPKDYVLRIAESKARDVSNLLSETEAYANTVVAADTCVVDETPHRSRTAISDAYENGLTTSLPSFDILGKPTNNSEAISILRRLRDRTHQVYTGIVLLNHHNGFLRRDVCVTDVPMRNYLDEEIIQYVNTGDPFDKAGGYAIQHDGFHPVQNLQGCYANVMGLPLCHLKRLLDMIGIASQIAIDLVCLKEMGYVCPIHASVLKGDFSLFDDLQSPSSLRVD
jgi:predicted house-cleaning NTP pyrophosphatase (Maf/HAM1 superfamily)